MWLNQLNRWKNEGTACAIVTITATTGSTPRGVGSKMVVDVHGNIAGSVGGGAVEHQARAAAQEAIAKNVCLTKEYSLKEADLGRKGTRKGLGVCGGTVTVFIEPVLPRSEVVAFGAGHIAEKLGRFCDVLNVPYRVYDNRQDYATVERFPGARERVVAPFEEIAKRIQLTRQSYCAIFTHGHMHDRTCLEQLLANRDVPYIGMIGSATKIAVLFRDLAEKGIEVDDRVYSPIGIKLGSQLPEEIAFSILAEIFLLMNGGKLEHFRIQAAKL